MLKNVTWALGRVIEAVLLQHLYISCGIIIILFVKTTLNPIMTTSPVFSMCGRKKT